MSTALYTGSFDPFTNGHLQILKHAANIFDEVYICVMNNPMKKRLICTEDIESIIEDIITEFDNVKLIPNHTNLAYKEAKLHNCDYLVRGIRNNGIDYAYEENNACINEHIGHIDTVYIRAGADYSHISSTLIKALMQNGENIDNLVPPQMSHYIKEMLL